MAISNFDQYGRGSRFMLLNGIENKVLNYTVIRGFAPIVTLAEISNAEKYQRDIIPEHALAIKNYLDRGQERFFPEIILSLNTSKLPSEYKDFIQVIKKKTLASYKKHYDSDTSLVELKIKFDKKGLIPNEVKQAITRVDGNHRLHHAKDYENKLPAEYMVSFCIIDLSIDTNLGNEEIIFHLINNKAEPLLDEENFRVLVNNRTAFSDRKLKEDDPPLLLTRYIGENELPTIRPLYKNFGQKKLTRIYEISKIILESKYIDIGDYPDENVLKDDFLEMLGKVNSFYDSLSPKDKIQKLQYIIPLIVHVYLKICKKDENKTKLWLNRFIDWLKINDLFELKNVQYDEIWGIFHKLYESKSNKVFISMEYTDDTKDVFDSIKQVIDKVNRELGLSLKPIRIDKYRKGVTYSIPKEILKQIQEGGLLIGDLTNQNANVYHEIGYMMGLCHQRGIEEQVILILKDNGEGEPNVKFNLAHKRQIRFKTYTELKKELYKELETYCKIYKIGRYLSE